MRGNNVKVISQNQGCNEFDTRLPCICLNFDADCISPGHTIGII